jgi:hypothetical protein
MSDDVVRGEVDTVEDGPEYDLNFREHPERYVHTDDEKGAFKVQPYKDELLPLWGIATLEDGEEGAEAIRDRFREYREDGDFVGMDLARKYLQMGWTRSLRYAKYPGGRKYDDDGSERDPQEWYDEEKREIARVYRDHLDAVREDETYREALERHRKRHG